MALGIVDMLVKELVFDSGLGAGGGGGGRLASPRLGLGIEWGALRTALEGDGGTEVDSWKRA
jgi:hypothetical protein